MAWANAPARHQCDARACLLRRTRQGESHFSAGTVGDASHRINGFVRRPGCDQHRLSGQDFGRKMRRHGLVERPRLQHAPVAHFAAGLLTMAHAQHLRAVGLHLCQIALGGRVAPHFTVHGRGNQQGHTPRPRQAGQAHQLIGAPQRQPRSKIRTARRQQDEVGLASQTDVRHVVGATGIPLTGKYCPAR